MSLAAPLLAILADPSWLAMDATARGYHVQLILAAAQRKPAGTLPGHEATLRRYLGMGPARVKAVSEARLPKTVSQHLDAKHANLASFLGAWWAAAGDTPTPDDAGQHADAWQEHLWQTHWRPMVMAAWEEIDDALIAQMPHLARAKGGYYSRIAENLANMDTATKPDTKAAVRKKVSKKTGRKKGSAEDNPYEDPAILVMGQDVDRWHDAKEVFSRWMLPLDENSKRSLWEVGVMAMTGSQSTAADRARAKAMLGRLVKTHGEARVAEAIGVLSVRAVPVADAGAFLAAMLRNKEEGSPLEQKARSQRARVAL